MSKPKSQKTKAIRVSLSTDDAHRFAEMARNLGGTPGGMLNLFVRQAISGAWIRLAAFEPEVEASLRALAAELGTTSLEAALSSVVKQWARSRTV